MGEMTRRRLTACWCVGALLLAAAGGPPPAAADEVERASSWHWHASAATALMLSRDQLDWLAYDKPGFLFDLQVGYALLPWLDVQVGSAFGVFISDRKDGGLAAPTIGALARWPDASVAPYAFADIGGAFTGALLLPMVRAGIGLDVPVGGGFRLGPVISFGNVIYSDAPGSSTDARYIAIGISGMYAREPVRQEAKRVVPPPPPVAAPRTVVVREPGSTVELMKLVDRAVPGRTDQVELLAPVLFAFDSDELEPVGVAMLHEVAHSLGERSDLELIEIRAYADARGSADYNKALAGRRGQRVYDWLVEHGVEPARLTIAPLGAEDFVETGADETAHEQNRRVVFRVLRITEKP